MNVGLKISRPNRPVETTDNKLISYSSEFVSPKILKEGSLHFDFALNDTTDTVTIAHGLGFSPIYTVYAEVNNSNEMWQHWQSSGFFPDIAPARELETYTDSYNLNIIMTRAASQPAATYRGYYYIFMDIPIQNATKIYKRENIGIKVSQPGIDVEKAGDVQLSLNSVYKTFKVFKEYDFTITFSGTTAQTLRLSHGLGYWPAFEVAIRTATKTRLFPLPYMVNADAALYAIATKDELIIKAQPATDPGALSVQGKAIIFYDQLAG